MAGMTPAWERRASSGHGRPARWRRTASWERGRLARNTPKAWAFPAWERGRLARNTPEAWAFPRRRESASRQRGRPARIGRGDPIWQA